MGGVNWEEIVAEVRIKRIELGGDEQEVRIWSRELGGVNLEMRIGKVRIGRIESAGDKWEVRIGKRELERDN